MRLDKGLIRGLQVGVALDQATAVHRSSLSLLLAFNLVSCSEWRAVDRPLPMVLPESGPHPGSLRIYTARGGWVAVRSPRLRNDSLIWIRHGGYETGIPVADISMVQRAQVDVLKTAGLIVLGAAAIGYYIGMKDFHDSFKD